MRTHRLVDDRNVLNIWLDRFDAVEQQLLPIKDIVRDTELHGLCSGDLLVGHVFVQSCSPTRQARVKTRQAEAGAGVAKQAMRQDGTSSSHQRMQTAAIPAPFLDALIKPFFILGPPSLLTPANRRAGAKGKRKVLSTARETLQLISIIVFLAVSVGGTVRVDTADVRRGVSRRSVRVDAATAATAATAAATNATTSAACTVYPVSPFGARVAGRGRATGEAVAGQGAGCSCADASARAGALLPAATSAGRRSGGATVDRVAGRASATMR